MRPDELDMKLILRGTYLSPRRVLARRVAYVLGWNAMWIYALVAHGPFDAAVVTLVGLGIFLVHVAGSHRRFH